MHPPLIFDRNTRRLRRDRMRSFGHEDRWMIARMAQDVIERLDSITRAFRTALILGSDFGYLCPILIARGIAVTVADPGPRIAAAATGVHCDEDRLPFEAAAFDLVIALGTLDSIDDLPGALIQIRRSLAPDGLFLGSMMGAGSLPLLKSIFATVMPGSPHIHPQIDVRAMGDLLTRAGFVLPVTDSDEVTVRYSRLERLVTDLRANGQTNVLASRRAVTKREYATIKAQFEANTRLETVAFLYMTGWAPPSIR